MSIPSKSAKNEPATTPSRWKEIVARYEEPGLRHSLWQLINTLVPYAVLWYLMYLSLGVSYWLTGALALLAAGFQVRVFIIFHDCGHGSFFKSRRANHILGLITGVLSFTPVLSLAVEHALHHATAGDLDRRGAGDMWTLTVQEYLEASKWKRFTYRLARNPVILFVLAPVFLFAIKQRFASPKAPRRERRSVLWTNLALLAMATGLSCLLGLKTYLLLQLGVFGAAGSPGCGSFTSSISSRGFIGNADRTADYCAAALQGSSFYKLPKILQWFSGNIGFHHIHHLSPRIPNYKLEQCHLAEPLFQTVKPVTLFASFKALTFRLWDEQRRKLVGFSVLKDEPPGMMLYRRPVSRTRNIIPASERALL